MKFSTKTIVWVFLALALLLNVPRLILGTSAPVKRTDVADMYVNKFAHGAEFWKNPQDNLWDASILRGAPVHLASVQPQHLCSFLSIVMPAHVAFTIFQILMEFLVLFGTYLFFYHFLGYKQVTALYASAFHLSMYLWFNENPFVTQTFLSILFVAVASIGQRPINGVLRFILLVIALFVSFPPYTVPMAPLAHGIMVYALSPQGKRKINLMVCALFWLVFSIFYLPNLWGYLTFWKECNRALWEMPKANITFAHLIDGIRQMYFWFPCVVVIALFQFYKINMARWIIAIQILILLIISQGEFLRTIPILSSASFAWSRLPYYSSIMMLFLVAYLIEHYPIKISKKIIVGCVLWMLAGFLALKSQWISRSVGFTYIIFSALAIFFVVGNGLRYATSALRLFLVVMLFLLPCKIYAVKHYEDVPYGYLYQDAFEYKGAQKPFRVVSLSDECWHPTFYPAQASIKGQETFDGVSVFYNKEDARNWIDYVVKGMDYCSFKGWNNRVELVRATWDQNADSILLWLRINNTAFIRSSSPIMHEGIRLVDKKEIMFPKASTFFSPYLLKTSDHYLYQVDNTLSRVFSVDVGMYNEAQLLDAVQYNVAKSIVIESYTPSRITWEGNFDGKELLASINYDKHWQLSIDGKITPKAVTKGPMAMIKVNPLPGEHHYALIFQEPLHWYMGICMMVALGLLIVLLHVIRINSVSRKSS